MSLGFENVDKKTLNSYTKKSEKKVEMNTLLTCQHFGMPHLYNRKHALLCLSLATTR